jgi:hypothetical protein
MTLRSLIVVRAASYLGGWITMIRWSEVVVRQREYEQTMLEAERNARLLAASGPMLSADRWQWRVMNAVGGWLVEIGCRLQTHVQTARRMVYASRVAVESNSESIGPCQ